VKHLLLTSLLIACFVMTSTESYAFDFGGRLLDRLESSGERMLDNTSDKISNRVDSSADRTLNSASDDDDEESIRQQAYRDAAKQRKREIYNKAYKNALKKSQTEAQSDE
jgi:hypothetical protein